MRTPVCFGIAAILLVPAATLAKGVPPHELGRVNGCIAGQVVDYTANHNGDRRIFSESLQQKRDLYVYLPPGFDPKKSYPLVIFLHGILQDETSFLEHVAQPLDQAILSGRLPPLIVAVPDGSLSGSQSMRDAGSFFINSPAGKFEDYVMKDVWTFVTTHYPIRPEREAHVLVGVSMGGLGAYNWAIKHRERFRIVIGILPVLNVRWLDCHCRYLGNFDPCCWGWRTNNDDPCEVVGRYFHGVVKIRMKDVIYPVFGSGPEAMELASRENPIEMVDRLGLKNGELDMYVGYAGKDEFNLDAHAESFLYTLHARGIDATVNYHPHGRHSERTARAMIPDVIQWLDARLRGCGIGEPVAVAAPFTGATNQPHP